MNGDRTSWQVHGTALGTELAGLLDITGEERQILEQLGPAARVASLGLSAAFYERLLQHAPTAEYLQQTPLSGLHATLHTWFIELFGGVYDEKYVQRRLAIGHAHVRAGIPVRYPLAMLDIIMAAGDAVTQQSPQPDVAHGAFQKVLALDIALFNQAYEDNQLRYLAHLVGGERLARRLLAGEG